MSGSRPPALADKLVVLGELGGFLFVDKPAGLQTEPDANHTDTLVSRVASQLGVPVTQIHALSRLDTGVSGVVTLGLTREARRLATELRDKGQFRRRYLALATGQPTDRAGAWLESIGRASGSLRRVGGRHPELARTDFALIASSPIADGGNPRQLHLLALAPQTGRTHQLRVHAAAHGLPLLGDRAYGGLVRLTSGVGRVSSFERIALHAAWVELPLPGPRRIAAAIPPELSDIWRAFGGDDAALANVLEASVGG